MKAKKKTATPRRAPKKPAKARKSPEEDRFARDLLVRGEAAKPDEKGKLPPDATHVITKENPDGTAEVRRVRFKLF